VVAYVNSLRSPPPGGGDQCHAGLGVANQRIALRPRPTRRCISQCARGRAFAALVSAANCLVRTVRCVRANGNARQRARRSTEKNWKRSSSRSASTIRGNKSWRPAAGRGTSFWFFLTCRARSPWRARAATAGPSFRVVTAHHRPRRLRSHSDFAPSFAMLTAPQCGAWFAK